MPSINVVFDTNILLSALLSLRGAPFHCLALAKAGSVQSVTCQEILRHLLPLGSYQGIRIVRAVDFLALVTSS